MLEKILSHLLCRVNTSPGKNRRGLGYVAELIVTTTLSTLRLDFVITLLASIYPRPVSSQIPLAVFLLSRN